jgi:8-oxo-dGTP diphosphatase
MSEGDRYPRPALTVDCVVFGLHEARLEVLLIERDRPPFEAHWALPGGFVHEHEPLDTAARRELEEETDVRVRYLEQLYTFGDPGRDPRGHVVTVAYFALVNRAEHPPTAATDARRAAWFPADTPPPLAFDHPEILRVARERLRAKLRYRPIGFDLLPEKFTLGALQRLYETVLGAPLDKRNFRKKLRALDLLVPLDERQRDVPHRAAQLYRFDREKYARLEERGFDFSL